MYHFVARIYIAQNVSKLQRRGRPRPWSLKLFCFVFWGSRHWLKNNFAAFMHSFHTHLYKEQQFDAKKWEKNMVATQFLRSHVTTNEFRTTRCKRINIYGTTRCVRWRRWLVLLSTSSATIPWFLTIASKFIYGHVTSKKLGCDHIFCRFLVSSLCSLYR